MDFLQGLNPQQRNAVEHVNGPLLILAGAGSGKTRVITHRIAHLIHAHRIQPSSILAVTFTNKAAEEMRRRVSSLVGPQHASGVRVMTFHSFCVRMLRRDGAALADLRPGFTGNFTIYDDGDQLAVIKAAFRQLGLDEKVMKYRGALSQISQAKNHKQRPQDLYKASTDPQSSRLAVVYENYEGRLRQANALDFDDLLLEGVRLLQHDTQTREAYNKEIRYLLVDEYQDTNRSQYELVQLLSLASKNVCVVGDEDQSIYGWRGADIRNILDFERDYPNAVTIRLEQNYRSTETILQAASAVVAHNTERKGKWLWTDSGAGDPIGVYQAFDAEREALFIADTIERRLAGNPEDRVAILYRTNAQSRQIEEALRRYGRKYLVVGGFSFYQRAEVKDILAYLKAALFPGDSVSLLRIMNTPARGIGKSTLEHVEQFARAQQLSPWDAIGRMLEQKEFSGRADAAMRVFRDLLKGLTDALNEHPLDKVLQLILERTGYQRMLQSDSSPDSETRLENLSELLNAAAEAAERGEDVAAFLDHAALVSDSDGLDESAQVSLLTLHNAKGLEFPVVFLAGLEERLFPHGRSMQSEAMMEEERRLFYVGMTRARKSLTLTWAKRRRKYGGGTEEAALPSRFLAEIPAELTQQLGEQSSVPQLDLTTERDDVRKSAKKNTYTGKTYNSLEHIAEFFSSRAQGKVAESAPRTVTTGPKTSRPVSVSSRSRKKGIRPGSEVQHPRYGRGTVLRREGEGDQTKVTVNFPGYGLKKLIAKYAGLKVDE